MKKRSLLALLLLCVLAVSLLAGCGKKAVEPVDLTTCTYEDFIGWLKANEFIAEGTAPVDMNTTAGYLLCEIMDENYEIVGYESFSDKPYAFADKAEDYDGLYVIWYDTTENGAFAGTWGNLSYGIELGEETIIYPLVFKEDFSGYGLIPLNANGSSFLLGFAEGYDEAAKEAILTAFKTLKVEHNTQG